MRKREYTVDERRRREQGMYKMPMAGRRRPVPWALLCLAFSCAVLAYTLLT
jgi:hypothetical protein